jgi:ABC-type sugar transport system substrate-binding protein
MRNLIRLVIAGVVLGLLLAACGGGSSSSSSSPSEPTESTEKPSGGEKEPTSEEEGSEGWSAAVTKEDEEAGVKAAGSVKPAELAPITVGYIDQVGAVEVQQRALEGTKAALAKLGWKLDYCDAEGIPTKMTACANTLLNEHVDAILSTAMSPSLFATQLKRAKSEGIPWVNTEDHVENEQEFTGTVAVSDQEMSEVLTKYVVEKLGEQEGTQEALLQTYAPIYGVKEREEGFENAIKGHPITIVESHEANLEAIEEDAKKNVESVIKQHPNLAAVYSMVTPQQAGVAGAWRTLGLAGKEFPERPLTTGFFADKLSLKLIGEGLIDAVVEVPIEVNAWAALDQLAAYLSREQKIENTMPPGIYPVDLAPPVLVTKENLPPEGQRVKPEQNYEAFFMGKWGAEYTNVE